MLKTSQSRGSAWTGWLRATLARAWRRLAGNRRARKQPRLPPELESAEDWLLDDVGMSTGSRCDPPRSRPDHRPKTFEEKRSGHTWQNLK